MPPPYEAEPARISEGGVSLSPSHRMLVTRGGLGTALLTPAQAEPGAHARPQRGSSTAAETLHLGRHRHVLKVDPPALLGGAAGETWLGQMERNGAPASMCYPTGRALDLRAWLSCTQE